MTYLKTAAVVAVLALAGACGSPNNDATSNAPAASTSNAPASSTRNQPTYLTKVGSGTGSANAGGTLNAAISQTPGNDRMLTVRHSAGWSCTGEFSRDAQASRVTVPMSCSNGNSGEAEIVDNGTGAARTMTLSLANGAGGQVML